MKRHGWKWAVIVGVSMAACGVEVAGRVDDNQESAGGSKQAEAWASQDDPSLFSGTLEYRFAQLPTSGQAANVPWAGSYWPTYEDNINYKWAGPGTDSAPKKYEKAFGGSNVEDAVSRYHGIESVSKTCTNDSTCNSAMGEVCAKREGHTDGRCVATWWGICHAWTPAAILLPEPRLPVTRNGVTFQVQDLKALASLVHNSTQTKFVSLRCNKVNGVDGGIRHDQYGRIVDGDRECRDTNAGTYHVLLANYLGLMRQAFAEDRIGSFEVWNQPLRSYRIVSQRTVTATEANALVGGQGATYSYNPAAVQFVSVRLEVKYIGESSASTGYIGTAIDRYTHSDVYDYVLELDAAGKIIGGEWVGSSKDAHPDFLWLPLGVAAPSVAGGAIRYDVVKSLVLESAGQTGPSDGGVGQVVEVREAATLTQGEWRHFGPYATSAGTISVTMTGTGDADLYTRMNGQPSLNLYDCRPYGNDANENCLSQGPGGLYVSVHGYSVSNVSLVIRYSGVRATDGGVPLDAGTGSVDAGSGAVDAGTGSADAGVTHLNVSDSVGLQQLKVYTVPVTQGRRIVVRTQAANDVDVYVKLNGTPTLTSYDTRAFTSSGNEQLSFLPSVSGVLSIGVYGYAASPFNLTTADN